MLEGLRRVGLLVLLALFACSDDGPSAPSPTPDGGTCTDCAPACAEGFAPSDRGGCDAVLPAATCAAGSRLALGRASCTPVGVTSCPEGFAKSPSGWGCDAVVPATRCSGPTMERLGKTECQPIGDCAAPFPPPGATRFVNANYTDQEIDATHARTITEALTGAPAGTIVAVDAGTYTEKMIPTVATTIVGRCPAKTIVTGPATIGPGLRVENVQGVVVKNLTISGFNGGVASVASVVELDDVLVENSTVAGAIVSESGASLKLVRSVVRGTRAEADAPQATGVAIQRNASLELVESVVADAEFVGLAAHANGTAKIRRSVFRDGLARLRGTNKGVFGVGIFSSDGADVLVEETAVLEQVADGIVVSRGGAGKPASATVRRSTIRGTTRDSRDFARGIEVGRDSKILVEGCTVVGNDEHEILVTDGATGEIKDSTTRGSLRDDAKDRAGTGLIVSDGGKAKASSCAFFASRRAGLQVQEKSTLDADNVLVTDVVFGDVPENRNYFGFGLSVRGASTAHLSRSTIVRAHTVGVLLNGRSTVSLDGVVIADMRPSIDDESGRAISVQEGSTLTMARSALLRNLEAGAVAIEASSLEIRESVIRDSKHDKAGSFGLGVLVADDSRGAIDKTTIDGSAAIAVAVAAARASVTSSVLSRNAVAVHAQNGVTLVEEAPTETLDALTLLVSPDTRFIDNATKVGSGFVPLPPSLSGGQK